MCDNFLCHFVLWNFKSPFTSPNLTLLLAVSTPGLFLQIWHPFDFIQQTFKIVLHDVIKWYQFFLSTSIPIRPNHFPPTLSNPSKGPTLIKVPLGCHPWSPSLHGRHGPIDKYFSYTYAYLYVCIYFSVCTKVQFTFFLLLIESFLAKNKHSTGLDLIWYRALR